MGVLNHFGLKIELCKNATTWALSREEDEKSTKLWMKRWKIQKWSIQSRDKDKSMDSWWAHNLGLKKKMDKGWIMDE